MMCEDPGKGTEVAEQIGLYCLSPDCDATGRALMTDGKVMSTVWGVAPTPTSGVPAEMMMGPYCPDHMPKAVSASKA